MMEGRCTATPDFPWPYRSLQIGRELRAGYRPRSSFVNLVSLLGPAVSLAGVHMTGFRWTGETEWEILKPATYSPRRKAMSCLDDKKVQLI